MSRFLRPELDALAPYVPGEQPKHTLLIKLNTNENPYPPSKAIRQAVQQETESLHLYPDPNCEVLVHALSNHFGVHAEQVFVGNGSDEVLAFCFQAFCPRGVAFADVTYGFYSVYAQLYQLPVTILPLNDHLAMQPSNYYGVGRAIFIANPNTPTGLALSIHDIEGILCENKDELVVVDEAYVDFGADSARTLLGTYTNLLIVGTLSKSRSLAGGRIGYAVGSSDLIDDLNRIKFSFNPYSINRMSMAAATASVKDTTYFHECCQAIIRTRTYTRQKLAALGCICTDSLANFILMKHPSVSGEQLFCGLRERGILVRWFTHPRIRDYVRVSIGTREQMECLLDELAILL